jgi:hypothetical protein
VPVLYIAHFYIYNETSIPLLYIAHFFNTYRKFCSNVLAAYTGCSCTGQAEPCQDDAGDNTKDNADGNAEEYYETNMEQ